MTLIYAIKRFCRNVFWGVIYAFQRVYKGYDNRDVFGFNDMFIARMVRILEEYKKDNIGLWWKPNSDPPVSFSKEETDMIIGIMLWHFKMADEDFVWKIKFGPLPNDYYPDDFEKYRLCDRIAKQNQDRAIQLFALFFNDLWI